MLDLSSIPWNHYLENTSPSNGTSEYSIAMFYEGLKKVRTPVLCEKYYDDPHDVYQRCGKRQPLLIMDAMLPPIVLKSEQVICCRLVLRSAKELENEIKNIFAHCKLSTR